MSKKVVEEFDLKKLQSNQETVVKLKDEIANNVYKQALLINKLQEEVATSEALRLLMQEKHGTVNIDLVTGEISDIIDGKPDQKD